MRRLSGALGGCALALLGSGAGAPAAAQGARTVTIPNPAGGSITITQHPGPPASRFEGAIPVPPAPAAAPALPRPRAGQYREQYVSEALSPLRRADRLGDGLDNDDIALLEAQAKAQARANALARVFRYDLDGDLRVTRAEVDRVEWAQAGPFHTADSLFAEFDADRDGVITAQEAAAAGEKLSSRGETQLRALLALDPNHDGRLTAMELTALAGAQFDSYDTDHDGKISQEEASAPPICPVDRPAAADQIVLYGAYQGGEQLPAVAGAPGRTKAAQLTIEPGRRPIYLLLASYEPVLWRLAGDTGRVARVVMVSYEPGGGVEDVSGRPLRAGVRAYRTTDCFGHFHELGSPEATRTQAAFRRALGRDVDVVGATYSAGAVTLPSGGWVRPAP